MPYATTFVSGRIDVTDAILIMLPIQVFTKDMVEKDDTLLLQAFPTTFFIDKDGNIVDSIEGSNDYDGWKAKIDEVLKKVEANE